jgi:RNA polymerase sigma-70 factor (ECF subfamily)
MALDRQRNNRRHSTRVAEAGLQANPERSGETTADLVAARERAEYLWNAIDALPEKLRLVVVLAGIEGHDMHEVSTLLDVPVGTVKSRLFLARKQLKERLTWMVASTKN